MNRHQIPASMFTSLAQGAGGPAAINHLAAAEYSRHMLLVRGVVDIARDATHPQQGRARQAYDVLASIQEQAPRHAETVLRYPAVGAWARRTLLALTEGQQRPGAEPGGLARVAAAAAIRAGFACTIEVPVTGGTVTFPSLGQAVLPGRHGMATVRCCPDGAELIAGKRCVLIPNSPQLDSPGWRGIRGITARWAGTTIRLLVDDLDPYRIPMSSLCPRLTTGETRGWQSSLRGAWRILMRHHRAVAEEIRSAIVVLVPRQQPARGTVSATARETFGCVALSAPSRPLELAVALAHEIQHAKLCAVLDIVRLTLPDDGRRYYAPWRDDPRPLNGLLQGAYAYLGVSGFWRRQRHHATGAEALQAHAEFARWRLAVLYVTAKLLDSGQLTLAGHDFVSTMAAVVRAWRDDPVPAEAADRARDAAGRHLESWSLRWGSAAQIGGESKSIPMR